MVAEWVDLWHIFEVCAKETGYEGGGNLQGTWWRKEAAEKQLEAMLKNISEAVGDRR